MSKELPDYYDADLVLRCYEMRREPLMRDARNQIAQFFPTTYEDITALMAFDHPKNAAFRQVSSYWEMVFGMARHGIANAEYLTENSGEGIFLFAKLYPHLEQLRKDFSPTALQNAEWVVTNTENGKRYLAMFQARMEKMKEMLDKK